MKMHFKIILIFIFLFTVRTSFAPPPAPGGGTNPACWPMCVPIDGGVVFLIAAIALYGVVKIYDYRKKNKANI